MPFLALALKYWPYIAIGVVAVLLVGYITTLKLEVSHYKSKAIVSEQKYQDEHNQHAADVKQWDSQVARLEASNNKLAGMYNKAITDANQKYNALSKSVDQSNKEIADAIAKAFKPGDVVDAPSDVFSLYNRAVGSANAAIAGQAGSTGQDQAGSTVPSGVRQTFDATTYTQVIVGNVNEYKALAIKYNALVDIVKGTVNGTNPSGFEGTSGQSGGNLSNGTPATQ